MSPTLSSSASGGVEESGQADETYDATFSWIDNDWTLTEHSGGATLDDYHYSGGSWSKTSTSAGDFTGGNGSWNDTETFATHDKVTHQESAYSGTETTT